MDTECIKLLTDNRYDEAEDLFIKTNFSNDDLQILIGLERAMYDDIYNTIITPHAVKPSIISIIRYINDIKLQVPEYKRLFLYSIMYNIIDLTYSKFKFDISQLIILINDFISSDNIDVIYTSLYLYVAFRCIRKQTTITICHNYGPADNIEIPDFMIKYYSQ